MMESDSSLSISDESNEEPKKRVTNSPLATFDDEDASSTMSSFVPLSKYSYPDNVIMEPGTIA
jgi:hypothetical protein